MFRFVILSTILFVFGVNGAPQALQQGGAEITASAYSNGQSSATAGGNPPIPIISQVESNGLDGSYNYSYETGNGIKQESSGFLKKAVVPKLRDDGTETGETQEEQVLVQIGSYSYTGPDGVVYTLKYVADENGFQPVADYLPTPPAIPEQILSSLKQQSNEAAAGGGFQAAQGGSYNGQYFSSTASPFNNNNNNNNNNINNNNYNNQQQSLFSTAAYNNIQQHQQHQQQQQQFSSPSPFQSQNQFGFPSQNNGRF